MAGSRKAPERTSKYPNSTKYGRQNPISERWNSDEQPTINEGVTVRAMEKKGIISDRCELNRQIRRDNALLRQLKAEFQKLVKAVKDSIPALAQAMEKLRANMIVFAYQVVHANSFITKNREDMGDIVSGFKQYNTVTGQIKQKLTGR